MTSKPNRGHREKEQAGKNSRAPATLSQKIKKRGLYEVRTRRGHPGGTGGKRKAVKCQRAVSAAKTAERVNPGRLPLLSG